MVFSGAFCLANVASINTNRLQNYGRFGFPRHHFSLLAPWNFKAASVCSKLTFYMPLKIPFYLVVTNLMTVSIAFHIWALTFC